MDGFTIVAKLVLNKKEFDSSMGDVTNGLNSENNQKAFSSWGVAMGRLAGRAIESAIKASVDFAKSVFETGMEFDEAMSYVKAIGGLTEDQFDAIREKAIDLGKSTKFTSAEVSEAFGYMALAGWDAEEMLAGIDGVLSLAAASGENLGRTSDIVTDALTAFGLTAADTGHFVDVLAAASANSNTTVSMMGEAFKYVAPSAGSLGYTIDDIAVALGLAANNGIKASQAGTSLRQIFNTLIKPSDDAKDAMDRLGLSLFESNGAVKSFGQVMQELRTVYQNSGFDFAGKSAEEIAEFTEQLDAALDAGEIDTEEYKIKLEEFTGVNQQFLADLASIGGLRGIGTLLALMRSTDKDFNDLTESVANSAGSAQTMAETMLDNLRGDITILNSAVDGLKILVSDNFKNDFRSFVQTLTEGVGEITEAFSEGGVSGMLINLTDWVINGITGVLTDASVTEEKANAFGKALGDFVGHLVAKLVTSAPELIGGLFEAGVNLASGLIQGLFAGLFGTGEGTVYGLISGIQAEEEDAIADANATAAQATGIVSYMDSLVQKYGEAASETVEWKNALEKLEELMPGITTQIDEETDSLSDQNVQLLKIIENTKQKAIEEAKQNAIKSYQSAYIEAETNAEMARYNAELAAEQADVAIREAIRMISENEGVKASYEMLNPGQEYNAKEYAAELYRQLQNGELSAQGLLGLGDKSADQLIQAYIDQTAESEKFTQQIAELETSASALKIQFEIASEAVARMAAKVGSIDFDTGSEDGSHASGLNYVPYDGYRAILHRGETVLNQAQSRNWRNNNSGFNSQALYGAVASAVSEAVANIQINMDGKAVGNAVTDQVSRNIYNAQLGRRFAMS